jgi:hypothetical protein
MSAGHEPDTNPKLQLGGSSQHVAGDAARKGRKIGACERAAHAATADPDVLGPAAAATMGVESRPVGVAGKQKRKRLYVYWCLSNRHGRRSRNEVCPNNLTVPMRLLDAAVIGCIAPYLTADVIADAVAEAVKRAGSRSTLASDRVRLEGELRTVETEIANLVAFVKQGKGSEAVQTEPATAEVTRGTLRTALERLVATEAFRTSSTAHVEQTLTAILRDWPDLRTKLVAQQRQLLRKLVPDRIAVTPHVRGDRKWVDWHGSMALAPIVSGITPALGDALPMGRRWWPQGQAIGPPLPVRLPLAGRLELKAA